MTCQRHLTFTSRDCAACQRGRTGTSPAPTSHDTVAQSLLTQSIVTNAASAACNPPSHAPSQSYCDTSSVATSSDAGCAPPSC